MLRNFEKCISYLILQCPLLLKLIKLEHNSSCLQMLVNIENSLKCTNSF